MPKKQNPWIKDFKVNYDLYLLSIPAFVYFIVFHYVPMYGVQIAFKDFIPVMGIWGSEWVGFENFQRFFNSYTFVNLIKNTLGISFFQLIAGFPMPIILALMLNELMGQRFKKFVQLVTYAPHFISTVALCGMIIIFLSPNSGVVNVILRMLGKETVNFLAVPEYFQSIFVFSGIWQNLGWGSVIYIAALSSIDPELYEAAYIDGANKLQKIINVDLPGIIPTMVILLIMRVGHIMSLGYEKILLLQNALNMSKSDVISSYVYRVGLRNAEYSYSAAIGLFNNLVNLALIVSVNYISRKVSENSLW